MPDSNENAIASSYLAVTTTSASPTRPETVRRCLFGAANSEENKKFVMKELADISKADQQKWNFNFTNGQPLEGRFQWETVANIKCLPAPYKSAKYVPAENEPKNVEIKEQPNQEKPSCSKNVPTINSANTIKRIPLKVSDVEVAKAKRNLSFNQEESGEATKSTNSQDTQSNSKLESKSIDTPTVTSKSVEKSQLSSQIKSNAKSEEKSPKENSSQDKQLLLSDMMPIKRNADQMSRGPQEESGSSCKKQKLASSN